MWAVADAHLGLCDHAGVPTGTPSWRTSGRGEADWKAAPQRVRGPYPKALAGMAWHASTAAPVEGRRKRGRPLSKAKYLQRPIADEYREGTVKSTPVRGVKETLKPLTCKQSEGSVREHRLRACLLKNEPASV
jgi:hypothetical protein